MGVFNIRGGLDYIYIVGFTIAITLEFIIVDIQYLNTFMGLYILLWWL